MSDTVTYNPRIINLTPGAGMGMDWLDTLDTLVAGKPIKTLDLYGHWRDGEYYLKLHWEANPNDDSPRQLDQLLREEIGRELAHCCTYHLAPNKNHDGPEECGFITGQNWHDRVLWLIQVDESDWHAVFTPLLPDCPNCSVAVAKDGFCTRCRVGYITCRQCGNIIKPQAQACNLCRNGTCHRVN